MRNIFDDLQGNTNEVTTIKTVLYHPNISHLTVGQTNCIHTFLPAYLRQPQPNREARRALGGFSEYVDFLNEMDNSFATLRANVPQVATQLNNLRVRVIDEFKGRVYFYFLRANPGLIPRANPEGLIPQNN